MKITLLKLGGSLITDKKSAYTPYHERIDDISSQIKQSLDHNPDLNLLLGNGAGSFAHQSAKKYGTMDGFSDDTGKYGACVVHHDAMRLNQIVMDSLIKHEVPAFSMQPSAMFINKSPSTSLPTNLQCPVLNELLHKHIIPVIYGDVIIDKEKGSTIFSTDTLFKILAEYLANQGHEVTVIHAGDYPGVLDQEGSIIPSINLHTYPAFSKNLTSSSTTDVTGGMKLKVEEMLELAKIGITSHIIDGTKDAAIFEALNGTFSGTTISSK